MTAIQIPRRIVEALVVPLLFTTTAAASSRQPGQVPANDGVVGALGHGVLLALAQPPLEPAQNFGRAGVEAVYQRLALLALLAAEQPLEEGRVLVDAPLEGLQRVAEGVVAGVAVQFGRHAKLTSLQTEAVGHGPGIAHRHLDGELDEGEALPQHHLHHRAKVGEELFEQVGGEAVAVDVPHHQCSLLQGHLVS